MQKRNESRVTQKLLYPFPIKRLLEKKITTEDNHDVFVLVNLDSLVDVRINYHARKCTDTILALGRGASNMIYNKCWSKVKQKLPASLLYVGAQLQKALKRLSCSAIFSQRSKEEPEEEEGEDPVANLLSKIIVDYNDPVKPGQEYYLYRVGKEDLKMKYGGVPPKEVYVNQLPKKKDDFSSFGTSFASLIGAF